MKVILCPLFFFIYYLGLPAVSQAQPDTLTFVIQNARSSNCYSGKTGTNPAYHHCDTDKHFSASGFYVFDSVRISGDTVKLFRDTSHVNTDSTQIIHHSLVIIFDSLTRVLQKFQFGSYSNWSYPHDLPEPTEGNQSEGLVITNIPLHRVGRELVGMISGVELSDHGLIYSQYYSSSNLYTDEYSSSDYQLIPIFYDTSFISIRISTIALLGIRQQYKQEETLTISPNPASNIITVNSGDVIRNLEFFDLLGRQLHVPKISESDNQYSFNISSLAPGIYWLRAGREMRKFVIAR